MTSAAEIILRCPECDGLNRSWVLTSITMGMTPVWTDDGGHAWPDVPSYVRCACCGTLHRKSALHQLGGINRGVFDHEIRLIALGEAPLKIMQNLRARFGWSLSEIKSRLSTLPTDLPPIRREEDALRFHAELLRGGAICELRASTIEAPGPPEQLNAPWLQSPGHPSELADRIPQGASEEFGVRLSLYWLSNDPYRGVDKAWVGHMARTPFEIENVRALLGLLDMNEEAHWLLRANIARESGDFSLAENLLREREPKMHIAWHKALQTLVVSRVERVTLLPPYENRKAGQDPPYGPLAL